MPFEYLGYMALALAAGGIYALTCKPGSKVLGFVVGVVVAAILMLIGRAIA